MAVVRVGIVLVGMGYRFVVMRVAMSRSCGDLRCMLMPMVCVMLMLVFVIHGLVRMGVNVMLGQVKP